MDEIIVHVEFKNRIFTMHWLGGDKVRFHRHEGDEKIIHFDDRDHETQARNLSIFSQIMGEDGAEENEYADPLADIIYYVGRGEFRSAQGLIDQWMDDFDAFIAEMKQALTEE